MEHSQHHRQKLSLSASFGVVAHKVADHAHEWVEHYEHPDYSEDVEQQVGQRRASSLCVGTQRNEVGSGRGADVLAHHEGYA